MSLASESVDFVQLKQSNEAGTLMALVPSADKAMITKLHQGNRSLTQVLQVTDPSRSIATSLAKHYQKNYNLRFVAKGTIKNIDPDFLQRALKKGRYVLDIRVIALKLLPDTSRTRFYPMAALQLSIIDSQKAKIIVEDTCSFSDPNSLQRLSAFSAANGKLLSSFLLKHANDCLNYFAIGKPMPNQTSLPSSSKPTNTVAFQNRSKGGLFDSQTTTATYQLGASYKLAKDAFDQDLNLQGYNVSGQWVKPMSADAGLLFKIGVAAYQQESWPKWSNAIYVADLGLGASFESRKFNNVHYSLLGIMKIGQFRQKLISISTNSLGIEGQVAKVFFDSIVLSAQYGLDKHFGQTKASNAWGHTFGVSAGFKH
ncbi:hypothetical protein ACFOND_08000 [Reinekea marina]|uniref:Uncharacterized protein n=1 Tax=Reinekea marina TaxID=1310421 RepID=A0ABV7WT66_9GAMM